MTEFLHHMYLQPPTKWQAVE